jgi:hypothetical protein
MTFLRAWTIAAAWLIVSRAAILAIGLIGAALFIDQHSLAIAGPAALDPAAVWHKWDSIWYERIALNGYQGDPADPRVQATAGFFPLYPLIVGAILQAVPSASFFWTGVALSNLLTFAALGLVMYSLAQDADHARRVALVTATAAGSFYFSIPYTESLFFLLVVAAMILARRERYLAAAVACGLGAVTRIHGLALVAIPLVGCLLDREKRFAVRLRTALLVCVIFAVPLGLHMAYLADVQGAAAAFVSRQALWDNVFPYPFKAVAGLYVFPRRLSGWVHGAFWLVYVTLLLRYWRRMPLGEALFSAGALVISTQQESFHGIYRYVMVLAPVTLALGQDRPDLRAWVVALNLVFGTIMILAFVTNNRLTV